LQTEGSAYSIVSCKTEYCYFYNFRFTGLTGKGFSRYFIKGRSMTGPFFNFSCNKSSNHASIRVMTEKQKQGRSLLAGFFRREYRAMVNYVRMRIDDAAEHDSEDIVQDVMASFLSAADVTAPINNLAAYCYQGLRNRVIDMLRRRRKHESLDAPLSQESEVPMTLYDVIADATHDTEHLVENKLQKENIMEAIDDLPDEQRAVVIATEIEGRSFSELAETWEVPLGTLLARKSRAFEKIRNNLRALEQAPQGS